MCRTDLRGLGGQAAGEELAIFDAGYRIGGVFAVLHAMPFVFVASASDLRRGRTRSVELPDLVGNGAHSQRQSPSNHARRRRAFEPCSTTSSLRASMSCSTTLWRR